MSKRRESRRSARLPWRSVAGSTSIRTTESTRSQTLSRRKLLLETLESRQLLAVDGIGLAGDSLTDEYINESYGVYAQNWISLVGQYRGDELPLGEYRPTTISPPNSFDAPWGDLRRAGYEYNWALAGADSFTLLDPIPRPPQLPNPIGQHILLAQAINAGDISHAVLAIGQNDFSPSSAAYVGIYDGSWDDATILSYSNQVLANIEQALTTINVGDVKLVMSNIIDYGVAPETQARNPDPAGRARVSFHIEALNDRIEALALDHRVPIIDSSRFAKDLLGPDSYMFGGVEIVNDPGQDPNNAFVHDGIHPHTITSSLIANGFMNAVNVFYDENLTLFTEQEVLEIVGLNYVTDTLGIDYNQYLLLPGPDIPPELQLHSNPNSNYTIFLDFDGNVTYETPWNNGRDDVLIDVASNITLAGIKRVWQIVAEDFAPFDVDVTTEEPGSAALRNDGPGDTQWGVRVVIIPSDIHDLCFNTCGGLGGGQNRFDASIDTQVYTFSSSPTSAGETSSHEVGHSLGLNHHGADSEDDEYYDGHDGATGLSWNAIMGGGSSRLTTWSDGSYFEANNSGQDDLLVITTENGFGYRLDDHQEELEFATPLRISNSNQVSFSGIIEQSDDLDVFTFEHGGGRLQLDVRPFEDRPNLDVWAGLYDEDGDLVSQPLQVFDPSFPESPSTQVPEASLGLSVSFDLTLPAGKYFLKVDGVGSHAMYDADRDKVWDPSEIPALPPFGKEPEFVDPWPEDPAIGYSDYASLGQYWITGTIVPPATNTINIEATDAIKAEGNTDDETSFVFTLTRTGPLTGATNVDYIVIPALPREQGDNYRQTVNGNDFRSIGFPLGLPSGFATFQPGEATTEIAITVAGDTVFEPDEYFEVLLFEPVGDNFSLTFQNSSAIGVIQSDENQFYIKAPSVDVIFQEEGDDLGSDFVGATYEFTVYRNGYHGAVDAEIAVPWTVDATAFANSSTFSPATPTDFVDQNGNYFLDSSGNRVFPSGKAVFAPGETEKLVTVYAKADRIFETDDAFHLVLGTPKYSTTANPGRPLSVHPDLRRSQGFIINEDIVAAPTLSVETRIAEIYENGDVVLVQQDGDFAIATRVTITRDGDVLNNPTVVTVSLGEDTADEAFLMIGPPGAIVSNRNGAKSIEIPFDANQTVFDNLYLVSVDDDELDGTQVVTLIANAENHVTGLGTALVHDENTALDAYVAKPDDSYRYELVSTIDAIGYTTYVIDMTSQTWRDATEVDQPVWQHWVQIIVPDNAVSETAVLVIDGGSRSETAPTQSNQQGVFFALQTNQVTVILPTVPSQPLIFADDLGNPRSEDEIIAYSFDKYLDVNSANRDEWPALLPMVKSAVRAMDTTQDFLDDQIPLDIGDFFVTGASKRGWTTWLTAAVDDRVIGIAPAVIDVLNMGVSMDNHKENYEGVTEKIVGGYAENVQDYTEFGIFDRFSTPEGRSLGRIVDPFQYRDRYADIPKYILNSTGDQFFTPDSSLWYFDDLPGEKYLWYVPNTDHRLNPEAIEGDANFIAAIEADAVLPNISWTFEGALKNTLRVQSDMQPTDVRLWQATRTDSIDFRQETNAPAYTSTQLFDQGGGEYVGTVPVPTTGGTAFLVELTYVINGRVLKFSTQTSIAEPPRPRLVSVNPGVSPHAAPDFSLSGLNVLEFAPQDLTFRFNPQQHLASNLSGIQIFASGGDRIFGNANDVRITPSSIGIEPDGYTVVATFAQPLPIDRYRIVITGEDDLTKGIVGLRNFNRDPFEASDGGMLEKIDFDVSVNLDFGDAPDSYGTRLVSNGARHTVQPWHLPRLGPSPVDTETDGLPVDSDDSTGIDDEDGISIGTVNDGANRYTVFTVPEVVDPTNVKPDEVMGLLNPDDPNGGEMSVQVFGDGFLDAWIDFDQNGTFEADEKVLDGVSVSGDSDTGTFQSFHVMTPTDALSGMTWMRVRMGESPSLLPVGPAIGGEVEDYPVEVLRFTPVPAGENEPPSFEINVPLESGLPTLNILERDDSLGTVVDKFVINIAPGDPTSLDELVTQTATITITDFNVPAGLMAAPPELTADGQLTVFPAPNAVGSAFYDVTVSDDHPSNPLLTTKRVVIHVRPVNDPIALNPLTVPSAGTNPADSEYSYSVASDGTITYRLREDNALSGGVTEPFFIPLHAGTTGPYNRIGMLDVLTVGPANEVDGTPGGLQTLSLISPTDAGGPGIIGVNVQQLTDNNVIDEAPQISGSNVVWASGANSPPFTREIFFWDGTTTTQLTDNDFTDRDPQVSGNNVTWWGQPGTSADTREIFFWDGTTITQVTNDAIRDELPQISGPVVVWVRGAGVDLEIYKWEGGTLQNVSNSIATGDSVPQIDGSNIVYKSGSSPNIEIWRNDGAVNAPVSSGGFNKSNPQVDGDRVVWEQFDLIDRDWDIYYFDGTQTMLLTDNTFNDFQPQISGQNIVWRGGTFPNIEIYVYDGVTTKQITSNGFTDFNPQIDGGIIVWQGSDGNDDEIFAWDGIGITQLTDNDYDDQVPRISGNQVVWQANSKGFGNGIEIFHAELTIGYATTENGGTLDPVYGSGGVLIGWNYTPPADFNTANGGIDSFSYEVTDEGISYDLDAESLIADPKTRTNRIQFVLAPVNDAPVFDLSTDRIVVEEDATFVSIDNFATNIGGGPIHTAADENNSSSLQALTFSITPRDFDAADMSVFFASEPVLDAQTGRLTFQVAAEVFGSYQFDVRLTDGGANNPVRGDVNQSASQVLTIHVLAQNDPPVIKPSSPAIAYTLNEDGMVEIAINDLLGVFDPGPLVRFGDETANVTPGGNQTVSLADPIPTATTAGGTLQLVTTGGPPRLLYRPRLNFNGTDTFDYTVTDGGVTVGLNEVPFADPRTAANTVTLNVNPVNNPPVFDIDAPLVGGIPTLNVLESDSSTDITISNFAVNIGPGPTTAGDETVSQQVSFSIAPSNVPSGLMFQPPELTPGGQLKFFPIGDAVGSATYTVTLTDDHPTDPRSTTKTFTIKLQPVNDRPALNSSIVPSQGSNPANSEDAYTVAGDGAITYSLREDNTQSVGVTMPFFIPLVAASTGSYDRIGLMDVFTVGPSNESDGTPGGSQSLSLLGPTVVTTTERGGTLTPVAGGWNYVPPADFNFTMGGVDSFSYEVGDNGNSYDPITGTLFEDPQRRSNRVELVLAAVNDAPVFGMSTTRIVVAEDSQPFSLANFATDIGGGPIGTAIDENNFASLQSLTFNFTPLDFDAADMSAFFSSGPVLDAQTGRLTFRTAANVFGSYRFEIRLHDGGANDPSRGDINESEPQLLTINVLAKNDPPTIKPDSAPMEYALKEDGTVEIAIDDLLGLFDPGPTTRFADEAADVTPGGNQSVSLANPVPTATSANGTLQLLTTGGLPRLLYTPRGNFNGIDTFVYTVTDDGVSVGLSEAPFADPRTATNTVTLNVQSVNDPPEFSLMAPVQSSEDAGPVTIANWATGVQAGPTTSSDEISGPMAQGLSFLFTQISGESNLIVPGSLAATINPQTKRASLSYQSAPNANGIATFQVVLQDDGPNDTGVGDRNVSPPQTFTINVAAINDPPSFTFVTTDPVSVAEDSGPQSIALIENISAGPTNEASQSVAIEVQPLAAQFVSLFTVLPTIDAGGVLHFTTAPNQNTDNLNGPVPVRILARDSEGGKSDLLSFQIEVSEVNDRPIANGDSFNSDEDTVLTIRTEQLMANDVDPDLNTNANEVVRVQLGSQSQTSLGAPLTYNVATGQISYDPTDVASLQAMTTGQSVIDSFTYSLIDAAGAVSDTVTVSLNIAGVNDAPILLPDLAFLETEGSTRINVLANDRDIDGSIDPTSVNIFGEPEFGTILVTATGIILYTPFVDIPAQHSFAYTVADNLGLRSKPLTVMISTNPAPTTGNDFAGTFKGESILVNVVANDADADGLDLGSLTIVSGPVDGQATAQSDATVLYEPDAQFVGSDSFTYQISDSLGRPSRITTVNTQVVASRLQNPRLFGDVNADGSVTAIDALLIINHLRRNGNSSVVPVLDSDRGPNYYDVNGNLQITAADALRVVNLLGRKTAELEAEPVDLAVIAQHDSDYASDQTAFDWLPMELSGPAKIVDTVGDRQPVSRELVEGIAQQRSRDDSEVAVQLAIDVVMAEM